ncbi:MAG: hypothetical protein WKG01_32380 [Kofleriaceae bacterium]
MLWQRTADCEMPSSASAGSTISTLPKGFGILFESIPLDTRAAIAALVAKQ